MNYQTDHSKRDEAQMADVTDRPREPEQRLDPRTANASGYKDEFQRRVFYWYDPEGRLPSIENCDFRSQHSDIPDAEWERLLDEAFDRDADRFHCDRPRWMLGRRSPSETG